jgi:hypothetical protein
MTRMTRIAAAVALAACAVRGVAAHPAPFSFLDLRFDRTGVSGTLVVHDLDAAHDLEVTPPEALLRSDIAATYRDALVALVSARLSLQFDGQPVSISWGGIEALPDRQSLQVAFTVSAPRPGHAGLDAYVFPYDPIHQTFVNVYEDGSLKHQAILDAGHRRLDYYLGTVQGRWAVVRTFVMSGIEHIMIGPDHVLFLIGLLLLGGSLRRLALIVTAFTIGHSITLSLAALDIVSPPSRLIEPLIALTIVVVGADNVLVLLGKGDGDLFRPATATDIRGWLAGTFGLIHGFGFAAVLKEFGLPRAALGWSLFSFNLGVEIGQLVIVIAAAGALAWIRQRSATGSYRVALGGSIGVVLAGLYWFVQRVFLV